MDNVKYLGDSVYVAFDGSSVQIFTNNGMGPENVIFLDPEVQISLVQFFESIVAKVK